MISFDKEIKESQGDDSSFKALEKGYGSTPLGEESPEEIARREYYKDLLERAEKEQEAKLRQQLLNERREKHLQNTFGGIRKQAERNFLDGKLFPEFNLDKKELRQKASTIAQSIQWKEVAGVLKQINDNITMFRFLQSDKTPRDEQYYQQIRDVKSREEELNKRIYEMIVAKIKDVEESLHDERERELFLAYYDEEASKEVSNQVPNAFIAVVESMIGNFKNGEKDGVFMEGDISSADLDLSYFYRGGVGPRINVARSNIDSIDTSKLEELLKEQITFLETLIEARKPATEEQVIKFNFYNRLGVNEVNRLNEQIRNLPVSEEERRVIDQKVQKKLEPYSAQIQLLGREAKSIGILNVEAFEVGVDYSRNHPRTGGQEKEP